MSGKNYQKAIAAILASLTVIGGTVATLWEQVCPIVDMCPVAEEAAPTPAANTTTNKSVEINSDSTSEGGDSKSGVDIGSLSF